MALVKPSTNGPNGILNSTGRRASDILGISSEVYMLAAILVPFGIMLGYYFFMFFWLLLTEIPKALAETKIKEKKK